MSGAIRPNCSASRLQSSSAGELALERQLRSATAFDRTLVLWRISVVRAALSFVEALLDQRSVEPVVYRPIGLVASPHTDLDGMPLQPIADADGESRIEVFKAHRGCLDDLTGFSHLWVIAHLHETTGWDPAVATFLDDRTHGTFATRSPRRPNAIGLSLARIVTVEELTVVVAGIDLLDGTPVLDLKPYVPLFDAPGEDVTRRLVRGTRGARFRAAVGRPLPPAQPALGVDVVGEEGDLVDVAPEPVLVRLDRAHDRMPRLRRMGRRVAVRRVVAARDVTAGRAAPQVHPPAVDLQAVLAAGDVLGHVAELDGVQVRARCHETGRYIPASCPNHSTSARSTARRSRCRR